MDFAAMAKLGSVCLFLLFTAFLPIHADKMRPSQSDVTSSLQDPKYKIDFHPLDSPVLPTEDQETIVMTDRDGKKFRCNLPVPEGLKAGNQDEIQESGTSTSLTSDERTSRKTPEDLLDVLKDKCFSRYEGWWIYELCYKGHLRQFHLHDKKKVQEFVLGTYDAEATVALHDNSPNVTLQKDPRSESAAQRYHAHVYKNGTICDLTNQPRETEVRFVCSESGRALINSIKEAPTCKYTLVFHAPMLCKHPAFQEERQPWVVIDCNAIPAVEVRVKEDTTLIKETVHEAEADAHEEGSSENKAALIYPPQIHPIAISEASTNSGTETEVPVESFEKTNIIKEVTEPSKVSERPATSSDGKDQLKLVEGEEKGEEKGEELTLARHQREEHPTT